MPLNEFVAVAIGHHVRHGFDYFPQNAHCLAPSVAVSSERTAAIVRFASSILKALPRRGIAGASSASAAIANLSDVGAAPHSSCSAIVARHGLCATPPSAIRTSWMMPLSSLRAAATEIRAKAYLPRSRTLL